ncbi:alanine:cation symporter family protein, partial [Pseudomonas aeruginosa]|nr:alanine:cation symporter family protein [Pseudomonas aeruginosa]
QAFSVFLDTFVICSTCTALLILLSGFYTPGFEGDGIVLTQNSLAAVVGDWGRVFVSVALSLFVFTCILYNFYLGENSLQFLSRNRLVLIGYRALVLALVVWGSVQDLSTVFAFADITMTCLAFVNLMRFLQEQQIERVGGSRPVEVDVRVLAATHVDLEAAIDAGTFREDLYYRLNVLQVGTAPLRERSEDLPLLANHFSRLYSLETGRRPRRFSEDALAAMAMHAWPGNVRELANRVRRGLVLAEGKQIEAQDLGLECARGDGPPLSSLEVYKLCAERQAMCDALARYGDNLSVAARMLGVSRPTFYRLLHKHRLR